MTYRVLSPDGFPIAHDPATYPTRTKALKALREWIERYRTQGYYRDARWNKIPVCDLLDACYITEN